MKAGKTDLCLNLDEGRRTDEIVAHKLGIGGKDTYRKEKYIVENKESLILEDLQDENSKLRALISNNFGRRKNDPAKDRKALATYVELKGYGQGRPEKGANLTCFSLDEIAKELNMSKRHLQRALRIERNLTDSMKELLDTGEITKTFASDTIASLTEGLEESKKAKMDSLLKQHQKRLQKN